ncbi:MAG: UDP-N-acetylmuramoyl-L-alanine--D-glutamate ligase [Acidimicrobiales bacterium]|nr:UDP-N-acetylmuramoyl-L-alanine--D-glutamate ligase [Acidimicrobiales bacterium]
MSLPIERVLVIGLGQTGQAVCRALRRRGHEVVAVDDHPSAPMRAQAQLIGVELIEAPDPGTIDELVGNSTSVIPSPGIPEWHPVFAAIDKHETPVLSEFDLAQEWDSRPIAAITGTDGKTTVTVLVTGMLQRSGVAAVAAGNNDLPLVAAIDDPVAEVFVVEASSFRLGHSRAFRPQVATWLNFAPDHLDVHVSLETYESAKARIWADLPTGAVAVANADDPVVMRHVPATGVVTFGLEQPADYTVADGYLRREGEAIVGTTELFRDLPHDLANALAAMATAFSAGASIEGIRAELRAFAGLPHRVELVGEAGGVRWFDDSKATVPHAAVAAVHGFDSVILIAGGRNKGLDLGELRGGLPHIRAVVAIGEAADEVRQVFAGHRPVVVADSMADAVDRAAGLAQPGDAVLLSPGCASFDWYGSYGERGDEFQRLVKSRILSKEEGGA